MKEVSITSQRRVARGAVMAAKLAAGLALAVVLLLVVVVPRLYGGTTLTVLTGSMAPTINPGDMMAVRAVADPCELGIGEVVTYLPRPGEATTITHRVVAKQVGTFDDGSACRLITQGDANGAVDEPVAPKQVRGAKLYRIPSAGWARQFVFEHPAPIAAGGGALALVLTWADSATRPRRVLVIRHQEIARRAVKGSRSC